ncbi:MAG: glycosidase, partial [Woeseiaceae bacterium]|nr:glycosidase [Woeseiaceae bacterium]
MRIKEQRRQLVQRRSTLLNAESTRVITRPHIPGDQARIKTLINRVSKLSDEDVKHLLDAVMQDFSGRHRKFRKALRRNFDRISEHVPKRISLSSKQQRLLGAYFTAEYSVEAAALFNPSIVPHPDQKGVGKDSQRFVMSFRATGEGHVSSIEFRSGMVDENHDIFFDPISQYVATPEMHTDPVYHRLHFRRKLEELGAHVRITNRLLKGLGETFTLDELENKIKKLRSTKFRLKDKQHAIDTVLWLARSNYEVVFGSGEQISERVIFPVSENESSG